MPDFSGHVTRCLQGTQLCIETSFDVEFITRETPRTRGTLGATGIGEMTMVSTAPAVTNAIKDACGVRIFDLPATPEKIKAALAKRNK